MSAGEDNANQLQKRAWDYFAMHAGQRLSVFNFYVILSSLTMTTYFASFKADSNLAAARPALALLLCIFAFIFWKLDQRTKFLIKTAEAALRYFEEQDDVDEVAKVFSREESASRSQRESGPQRMLPWRLNLSYSHCLNTLFLIFFVIGLTGLSLPVMRMLIR